MPLLIRALSILVILIPALAKAERPDTDALKVSVDAYVKKNEEVIIGDLRALIALPNGSKNLTEIRANAEAIVTMLKRRGVQAKTLPMPGGSTAVYGELLSVGATKTILIYNHFDGAPVGDAARWLTEPFIPTLRAGSNGKNIKTIPWNGVTYPLDPDWRIYGRSASDNKAPIVAMMTALDALRAAGKMPSFNIKFFMEGEEEIGSPNLARTVRKYRDLLKADLWLFCDGPIDSRGIARLALGTRGVKRLSLTIYGAAKVSHSGLFGNVAPNPGARLASLIASMRSENGRITIHGLTSAANQPSAETYALAREAYDDLGIRQNLQISENEGGRLETYGEAVLRPALNVLRFDYGGDGPVRSAIDTQASAVLGFRLTPGLSSTELKEIVERHIRDQGYYILQGPPTREQRLAHPRLIKISWQDFGYESTMANFKHPGVRRVIRVMRSATNDAVRVAPLLGGSLPISLIKSELDTEILIVPIVNADNNQHGPNENLRIQNFRDGIYWYAALLSEAGHSWNE